MDMDGCVPLAHLPRSGDIAECNISATILLNDYYFGVKARHCQPQI